MDIIITGHNKKWNEFIKQNIKKWQDIILNWAVGGEEVDRKVLVVHYEDLWMDESGETKRMLDFLGVEAVARQGINYTKFKRHLNTTEKTYDQFTPRQKLLVSYIIRDTINKVMRTSSRSKINLSRYLVR